MRVSASLLAVLLATLVGATAAHAQTVVNAQPAAAAPGKAPSSAKAAPAQARPAAPSTAVRSTTDSGKAKIEGVSTLRSTPADSKKDSGCSHSMANDA